MLEQPHLFHAAARRSTGDSSMRFTTQDRVIEPNDPLRLITNCREASNGNRQDSPTVREPFLEAILAVVFWTVDRLTLAMRVRAMLCCNVVFPLLQLS
jgi:hypothetical protein